MKLTTAARRRRRGIVPDMLDTMQTVSEKRHEELQALAKKRHDDELEYRQARSRQAEREYQVRIAQRDEERRHHSVLEDGTRRERVLSCYKWMRDDPANRYKTNEVLMAEARALERTS